MTDAEIIKVLEWCGKADCVECPYIHLNCRFEMVRKALDLINRLQADRDNYKQIAENQQRIILDKAFENKRLKGKNAVVLLKPENAQFENLEHFETRQISKEMLPAIVRRTKAEAYKEFAERLKERKYLDDGWSHGEHPYVVEESDIDEVLEELVGEDNG